MTLKPYITPREPFRRKSPFPLVGPKAQVKPEKMDCSTKGKVDGKKTEKSSSPFFPALLGLLDQPGGR